MKIQRVSPDRKRSRIRAFSLWGCLLLLALPLPSYAQNASTGITLIQPPEANAQGSTQLSFPLNLPPGRQGVMPELTISYDSEGSSGWLGEGWSLSTPAISVDTRWGAPRYSASQETESYLYEGQSLFPLAQRGEIRERAAESRFYPRIERAFERIIRHGNAPNNYWWEVTAIDGTSYYYGGTPANGLRAEACLSDSRGNLNYWGLVEVRDPADNFVAYYYQKVIDNGLSGSNEPGVQLYLDFLTYTGHATNEGAFRIDFIRDRELNEDRRPDVSIDLRTGTKVVTADLLRRIEISLNQNRIRSYRLAYTTGAFARSLLASITEENATGTDFYQHTFEYYDDIRVGNTYRPFGPTQNWDIPDDNIRGNIVNPIPGMDAETSALGGAKSSNFSAGAAATVGFNDFNLISKDKTAGGTYAYGSSSDEGLIALVDINGDALPDKVYRRGNGLRYRPNEGRAGTENYRFGSERTISGIDQFSSSKSSANSYGFEGNPPGGFVGYEYTDATNTTDTYFTDFNGDGLLDIAKAGRVYFNHLDANGDPSFTTNSGDTPSPIQAGADLSGDLIEIDPNEIEALIDDNPLHDMVRMWRAPYAGTIHIDAPVRLLAGPEPAASNYGLQDGVIVSIQAGTRSIWRQEIEPDDFSTYQPQLADITVLAGEHLYFRVQSIFDGAYDQVEWSPTITYTTIPVERIDADSILLYRYQAAEDFLVSSEQQVGLPFEGELRVDGTFTKPRTSDDLRVSILVWAEDIFDSRILFDTIFPADSIVQAPIAFDFAGTAEDDLYCLVRSNTQIDWRSIQWMPNLYYTASPGRTVTNEEGEPLFSFCPAVKYQMYNHVWRDSEPWIAPIAGTYTFSPELAIDNGDEGRPGSVTFSIKKGARTIYQEQVDAEDYDNFQQEVQLDLEVGDTLFIGYFLGNWHSGNQVADASFRVQAPNSDQADRYEAGYYSAISEDDEIFGHLYRGWGQFIYNGNRDRANQAILRSALNLDEDLGDIPEDIPEDPDELDGFYNPTDAIFVMAIAEAKTVCWLGYDDLTYLTGSVISSSRLGDDNILPALGGGGGSGLPAPNRISETNEHSVAGGIGVSVATGTASRTWTDTKVTLDVLDFNGDRYPDIISGTRIQYSTDRGGLQEGSIGHGFAGHHLAESTATGFTLGGSFVPSRTSNSGEAKGGSSNRRSAKAKRQSSKLGKTSRNAGNTAGDAIGISGTFSTDGDEATESWIDINGDGLVDKVFSDGRAALNYGYRFGAREDWGFPAIQAGESLDYGGGFGINLFNGSIAGGLSLTRTDNRVTQALEDVNGDGLPDIVTIGEPVKVQLNTGSGFGSAIDWLGIEELDAGSATGESVNGAFTVCVPIVFIGIKICFNPSTSVGQGVSRQLQQLGDIDGDAYPDFLTSSHDGELKVKPSTIGRTNKLRQVNGPLGGGFSLDYAPTGTTYELPYAIWTLAETIVDAGTHGTGTHLRFQYAEGYHDRHERAFYGFGVVTTQECDPASPEVVLRQRRVRYATDHFYAQGLLLQEELLDAEERILQRQQYGYSFRDPEDGRELLAIELKSVNRRVFPALVNREDQWFYGQPNPALTHRMSYDYDDYGNLSLFVDYGSGTEPERVQVEQSYHYREVAHQFDQWATVRVTDASGTLAERQAILNEAGSIEYLLDWIGPGEQARYDFTYDTFGNLTELQRPANANGERMNYIYTYDSLLHTYLIAETDAYGYVRTQTFDPASGERLSQTDANGQRTVYELDEFGRPSSILLPLDRQNGSDYSLRYSYAQEGTPHLRTERYDPAHDEPYLSYELIDAWGRPIQRQEMAEIVENASQSPQAGLLVSETTNSDALGRTTGQYRSFLVNFSQGGRFQAPTTLSNSLAYDLLDRPTSLSLASGLDYTIAYSAERAASGLTGHQWTITDPLGATQQILNDVRGNQLAYSESGDGRLVTTTFSYDGRGRLLTTNGPAGATIKQTYDGLSRRTRLEHPDAGTTEWRYDAAGNLLEKITPIVRAAEVENAAISYTYEYERLLQIDYPFRPQNQVRYYYGDAEADSNRVGRVWLWKMPAARGSSGTTPRAASRKKCGPCSSVKCAFQPSLPAICTTVGDG